MALYLTVALVLIVFVTSSQQQTVGISIDADLTDTYEALPAAYKEDNFQISITITGFNDTVLSEGDRLLVEIELPHDSTSVQNCDEKISGESFNCVSDIITDAYMTFPIASAGFNFSNSDPVPNTYGQSSNKVNEYTYEFKFPKLMSYGLVDDVLMLELQDVKVVQSSPLSRMNITAKIYINEVFKVEGYEEIAVIGPDLIVAGSSSPSVGIEAGDEVDFTIFVQHSSLSTQNALNVKVKVTMFQDVMYNIKSGTLKYFLPTGGGVAITANTLAYTGVPITTISQGDNIKITYTLVTNDFLEIGEVISAKVDVAYRNGGGKDYAVDDYVGAHTAELDFTTPFQDLELDETDNLSPGKSYHLRKWFSMPKGRIPDLVFEAIFDVDSLTEVPVTFTSSQLTVPGYVNVTPSDEPGADPVSGFVESGDVRKKRAVTITGQYSRSFGELHNSMATGKSGANISIELYKENYPRKTKNAIWSFDLEPITRMGFHFLSSLVMGKFLFGCQATAHNEIYIRKILQVATFLVSAVPYSAPATVQTTINSNTWQDFSTNFPVPSLIINKTVEMVDDSVYPNIVRFNLTVKNDDNQFSAFDVVLDEGSTVFEVFWNDKMTRPPLNDPNFKITDDRVMEWTKSELAVNEEMVLSYKAQPADDGDTLPDGKSYFNASVIFRGGSGSSYVLGPKLASVCIEKKKIVESSLFFNHGFTVLGLICGFIVGALVTLLIFFLIFKIRKTPLFAGGIRPSSGIDHHLFNDLQDRHFKNKYQGLVFNAKDALKSGMKALKAAGSALMDNSFIGILRKKSRHHVEREIEEADIAGTIVVDQQIEEERENAMVDGTVMLIKSLTTNGDINKSVDEKCTQKFRKNLSAQEKNLGAEFQKELEKIYRILGTKNKYKLGNLMAKQQEEMHEKTKDLSPKDQEEMRKILEKQHEAERSELQVILKLEQDEESEKLRKEYAIRRRMGIKDQQIQYLENVKTDGQLTTEQADWLMKEHMSAQATLEKLYDDEISRQRMILEEKLARRRALAEKVEIQDENDNERLNKIATQQLNLIDKMKKDGNLSPQEAQAMIDELQDDMQKAKEKMDAEKLRQEEELQKKLTERRKQKIEQKAKQHQEEFNELIKEQNNMSTQTDPINTLENRQKLLSQQRSEMASFENEIDKEHTEELSKLRESIIVETEKDMADGKEKLLGRLSENGVSDDQIKKIMAKHEKDMDKLVMKQEEEKQQQEENFKNRLAKHRKNWAKRQETEKQEQAQLREHEEKIVRKMIDSQVAMSESERDKIMQEHEKQMVKLENSLTLNKIQQKRMLEEKLAKKRAQQMEKLQKKQNLEIKKQKRKYDSEDEDDEISAEVSLMKKHAEQKMAILQGETIEIENEMEEIRDDMMKERALALKDQEVRLAAMLAELQMAKAKEMAKIEEQQKAIHNLKSNLMDDLHEKGVLSDPECQKVIEIHQKEQDKLNKKLDSQRAKQEKNLRERLMQRLHERERLLTEQHRAQIDHTLSNDKALKKKLQERLAQKEEHLSRIQDQQMEDAGYNVPSSTAAKLKRAALMTKHMVEMEKFRTRMETEINQTLEELKRQNDLRRMNNLQDQEIQFINGLVRMGKFQVEELVTVVDLLFPTKSMEEKQEMMDKLCEGYEAPSSDPKHKDGDDDGMDEVDARMRRTSSLTERVKSSTIGQIKEDPNASSMRRGKSSLKKKKGRSLPPIGGSIEEEDYHPGKRASKFRPDPVGRSYTDDQYSDGEYGGGRRLPPMGSKLAPLQPGGTKKKKKKNVKMDPGLDY